MKEEKMRTRIILIMLCIVFLSCIWVVDASAEQDYPMVCKGGGHMKGYIAFTEGSTTSGTLKSLQIEFEKAPQAASRQELPPGTCAWLDRPISAQEPTKLWLSLYSESIRIDFQLNKAMINMDVAGTTRDGKIVNWTVDGNIRYLVDAVYNGKLFYVRGYNDPGNRGYIHVDHVGP
jgi:hypothetical protein